MRQGDGDNFRERSNAAYRKRATTQDSNPTIINIIQTIPKTS